MAGNVDAKLDEILNLVMACSRGEVGNDAVESALSSIVSEHAPSTSTAPASVVEPPPMTTNTTSTSSAPPCMEALEPRSIHGDRPIIPDDGNYDDDDEDESGDTKRARNKPTPHLDNATAAKRKKAARKTAAERQKALEQIPLGRMGERMLITFGDGPVPDFEVISAALQGTRTTLQRAILDARALRRWVCEYLEIIILPAPLVYLYIINLLLIHTRMCILLYVLISLVVVVVIIIYKILPSESKRMIGIRQGQKPRCTEERLRRNLK
jgi:hypothetical protein